MKMIGKNDWNIQVKCCIATIKQHWTCFISPQAAVR